MGLFSSSPLLADGFPGLLELPLSSSLYEVLEEGYGVHPKEATERIESITHRPMRQ